MNGSPGIDVMFLLNEKQFRTPESSKSQANWMIPGSYRQVPRQVRTQVPPASMPPMQAFFETKTIWAPWRKHEKNSRKKHVFCFLWGKRKIMISIKNNRYLIFPDVLKLTYETECRYINGAIKIIEKNNRLDDEVLLLRFSRQLHHLQLLQLRLAVGGCLNDNVYFFFRK